MTRKERAPDDEAGRTQGGTPPPAGIGFPDAGHPFGVARLHAERPRDAASVEGASLQTHPVCGVVVAGAPARLSAEGRRGAHRPSQEENLEENPERAAEVRTPLTPEITTRERGGRKHAPGRARGSAGADATRDDTRRRARPREAPVERLPFSAGDVCGPSGNERRETTREWARGPSEKKRRETGEGGIGACLAG